MMAVSQQGYAKLKGLYTWAGSGERLPLSGSYPVQGQGRGP